MLLHLLLVLFLQQIAVNYSGFSAAERCHHEKNNGCESGFSYIDEVDTCIDVKHFSCPTNTGKEFEFVRDPYLCNVHHACHRGAEIDRVCCSSTEIFSITHRSCIQIKDTKNSLLGNCVSDPCAELRTTEVCSFKIVLPFNLEYPTDFCKGTTTTATTTSPSTTTTTTSTSTTTTSTSTTTASPSTTTASPSTETASTSTETASTSTETASTSTETASTSTETASTSTETASTSTETASTSTETASTSTETASTSTETASTSTETASTSTETASTSTETASTSTETASTSTETASTSTETTSTSTSTASTSTTEENTGPQETTTIHPTTSVIPGPPEDCTTANEGEYYCDPEDPHSYFYCYKGELLHDSCIGIYVFDCQNDRCVLPSNTIGNGLYSFISGLLALVN